LENSFDFAQKKDIRFINLRIFHMYGPNDNPRKFIPSVIYKAKNDEVINLTSGYQKRDFIYIDDVLDFFTFLFSWSKIHTNNFYNFDIGTSKLTAISETVDIIIKTYNSKSLVIRNSVEYYDAGLPDLKANFDTFENYNISWRPRTSLIEGIMKIKEFQ
jgi:CDP-paratose synthetase